MSQFGLFAAHPVNLGPTTSKNQRGCRVIKTRFL